jgi:hypothetical protein
MGMRAGQLILGCLIVAGFRPTVVYAQAVAPGNIFTDAHYMDSPEIARDRDWLFNYLSSGKSFEEAENIRAQVDRMSVAQVRTLLRFYHQKQELARQREAASRGPAPEFWPGQTWSLATEAANAQERETSYRDAEKQWEMNVTQDAKLRPDFIWNPFMSFRFNPLPFTFDLFNNPIPWNNLAPPGGQW